MARSLRRRSARKDRPFGTRDVRIRHSDGCGVGGDSCHRFAHSVGAGQPPNASLPYDDARAYLRSSETVWETVEDVADARGLKTDTRSWTGTWR